MTATVTRSSRVDDAAGERRGTPAGLLAATFAYLTLPHLIFLITWVRPVVGVPAAALLAAGAVGVVRRAQAAHGTSPVVHRPATWAAVGVGSVTLTWLSGAAGWGYQALDWWKHNAVFADLVGQSWPVRYELGADATQTVGLDYYLAHHLPAALVGRGFGWAAGNVALAVWTALGFALVLSWVVVLVPRSWRWGLAAFIGASGLDVVGWALMLPLTGAEAEAAIEPTGPEFWNGNFAFLSQLTGVADAPHQSIGIWLLTAVFLHVVWEGRDRTTAVLLLVLSPFWSVFATIGLALFAVVAWRRGRALAAGSGGWVAGRWPILALGPAVVVFGLYFAARLAPLPDAVSGGVDVGFIFGSPRYDIGPTRMVVALIVFLLIELALPVLLAARTQVLSAGERHLGALAIATMVATIPLKVGANHDLMLRASVPAIFVLVVLLGRVLADRNGRQVLPSALAVVLLIGLLTPALVVVRAATAASQPTLDLADRSASPGLVEFFGPTRLLGQYVASTDSTFWEHLAAD